jgi:predicted nucleic acid-binding Zn ribbon protein
MPRLYCGNNALHHSLVNGSAVLGTRRGCLEKGKQIALSQPPDPHFLQPYEPIDTTRKYCGNRDYLPEGYDRYGGLYECFLKGQGVGKRMKAVDGMERGEYESDYINDYHPDYFFGKKKTTNRFVFGMYLVYILITIAVFLINPAFLMEMDRNTHEKKRSMRRYCLFYMAVLVLFIIIHILCR